MKLVFKSYKWSHKVQNVNLGYKNMYPVAMPISIHYGDAVQEQRQQVMLQAYQMYPERFMQGISRVKGAPTAVYINPPDSLAHLS